MNVDVTTVSRKEQKLSKVPAAVYVITKDTIERSGANNIPDLLRTVPGVHVAQIEADRWAISVRGFDGGYSNKLLVLVDGRTVYTPSFSGVYWDQIDIPLNTIERIEVVRGSGGAVWGANAVNGVINIITEDSAKTQGSKVEAGGGSHEAGYVEAQYGGKIGNWGTYRILGDYHGYNGFQASGFDGRPDGWQVGHAAFRIDGRLSLKDRLTIDGDGYNSEGDQLIGYSSASQLRATVSPLSNEGFHLLTRWTHSWTDNSESVLQVYENEYVRHDTGFREQSSTTDIDFQNHNALGKRNDLVWGAGYRLNDDGIQNPISPAESFATQGFYVLLNPQNKLYGLYSGFVQDEFSVSKNVSLTAGTKVEHNAFTGLEEEPTARLAWTPNGKATLWSAISRSIRQPSRMETGLSVYFPILQLAPGWMVTGEVAPNPKIKSETADTYETGFRWMPVSRLSFDLNGFFSHYGHLDVNRPGTLTFSYLPDGVLLTVPSSYAAVGSARNFGGELSATASVSARWRVAGGYAWFGEHADSGFTKTIPSQLASVLGDGGAASFFTGLPSVGSPPISGTTPENTFSVESYTDLTRKLSFNQALYYVGLLPGEGVPAYFRLDLNCSYKLRRHVTAMLAGQNLLEPRHLEFSEPSQLIPTQPERSIFGRLTWSF